MVKTMSEENEQNIPLTYRQNYVVQLLSANIEFQDDASRALDAKAQLNFNIANIVLGILTAFNLGVGQIESLREYISHRPTLTIAIVAIYALTILCSIWALKPRLQAGFPLEPKSEDIMDWTKCTTTDFYEVLTETYEHIYKCNQHANKCKGRLVQISHILLALEIAVVFSAGAAIFP